MLAQTPQGVDLSRAMAEDATVSDKPEPAPAEAEPAAPPPKEEKPAASAAKPPPEGARTPAKPNPSELEINSPDRKTLIALFVVFAVTTVSWGAARFACNMHPPESRAAPKLPTERLLMSAKDAAIEFVQRWRSMDYEGALATVDGDELAQELQKAKADCASKANECARQREASAGRLTMAVVLAQDGFVADARVTTTLKGVKETYRVRMRREGGIWKAVSKSSEPLVQ
jgi:hypothetical protein